MPDANVAKNGSLLPAIDFIARGAWLFTRWTVKLSIVAVKLLLAAVAAVWRGIGKLRPCAEFCDSVATFCRKTGAAIRLIGVVPWRFGEFIGRQCNASAVARRFFLLAVIILCGLYFHYCTPAFDWGKWHFYESGIASYYGKGFYFHRTASGEWFLPGPFYTAAHNSLPLGTLALVVNERNQRRVVVRINDRGPYVDGRIIDLSKAAAARLGIDVPGADMVAVYTRKASSSDAPPLTLYPEAPDWLKNWWRGGEKRAGASL